MSTALGMDAGSWSYVFGVGHGEEVEVVAVDNTRRISVP